MTSPIPFPAILPPHPLDLAGVVKIALGRDASAALAACGPFHLALVAKADSTAPGSVRGEMILHCLPLDKATAAAAANVALGKARAVNVRKPSQAATTPPTPPPSPSASVPRSQAATTKGGT